MASTPQTSNSTRKGSIIVTVADAGGDGAVMSRAWVSLYAAPGGSGSTGFDGTRWLPDSKLRLASKCTDGSGRVTFAELDPASYVLKYEHHPLVDARCVDVERGSAGPARVTLRAKFAPSRL